MKRDLDWWMKNKLTTRKFDKLSPADKRIYIARDVLAQLQLGQLKAKSMTYVDGGAFDKYLSARDKKRDLGELLDGEKCSACAIGSLFVCAVRVADRAPVTSFLPIPEATRLDARDGKMREYLDRFFSREQQALIEAAFEGSDIAAHASVAGVEAATICAACAYNFGYNEKQRIRMTRIMRNIIRNGGDFNPHDATVAAR